MAELANNYPSEALSDESVEQMIALAERLKASNGGVIDDSAISAISEATGAPTEYVRLAIKMRTEQRKDSMLANLRAQYLTLEPDMRKYVLSGIFATLCAVMFVAESWMQERDLHYNVLGMFALVFLTLGLYNVSLSKDSRVAMVAGAIFGGGFFAMNAVFAAIFRLPAQIEAFMLIPFTILGAACGIALQSFVTRYRPNLGLKDPVKERQELLRQMVDLQTRLKSSEQHSTFVSFDVVGSTRMKAMADPLSVEFTFNEYHQFVERVALKHGGTVHSTAGDGIICAFDHPQSAFAAARNVQTGLIELNAFRNKIGIPIQLRAGIHMGTVMTAQAGDISSVNFAHVIDIAAHLQKEAPIGGIAISEAAAMYIPGGADSLSSERVEVDNIVARIWNPKPLPPLPGIAAEPAPS